MYFVLIALCDERGENQIAHSKVSKESYEDAAATAVASIKQGRIVILRHATDPNLEWRSVNGSVLIQNQ